jgi:hypothetical protein
MRLAEGGPASPSTRFKTLPLYCEPARLAFVDRRESGNDVTAPRGVVTRQAGQLVA